MSRNDKPIQIKAPKSQPWESFDFPLGYIGGMNTSANADIIALNETPDVCNMEIRNGIWSKRHGYSKFMKVGSGNTGIQGMHEFKVEGEDNPHLLVVSGGKLMIY